VPKDNGPWIFWGLVIHAILLSICLLLVIEYQKQAFRNAMDEVRATTRQAR